jgi:nucleoside phosphorylase
MILVTFALRQEGAVFEARLKNKKIGNDLTMGLVRGKPVAIYWLGVGFADPDRFKFAAATLKPELIVNSGFAGAVNPSLQLGNFLLAENATSPTFYVRLRKSPLFDDGGKFREVDHVIDPAGKARLLEERSVIAADMESNRVASVCQELGIPFVTARMVSDRFDEAIPGVFIGKGIQHPRDIVDAVRFAGRMLRLRKTLALKLEELIEQT